MDVLINGKHIDKDEHMDVLNPYDNSVVDTVPILDKNDVICAVDAANNAK